MAITRGSVECPACGAEVRRERVRVGSSPVALGLYAGAGVLTILWIALLTSWQPVWLFPKGGRGAILLAAVYLAPGLVVGVVAAALPRLKTVRCAKCGNVDRSPIR